jgi:hypothetical protein
LTQKHPCRRSSVANCMVVRGWVVLVPINNEQAVTAWTHLDLCSKQPIANETKNRWVSDAEVNSFWKGAATTSCWWCVQLQGKHQCEELKLIGSQASLARITSRHP